MLQIPRLSLFLILAGCGSALSALAGATVPSAGSGKSQALRACSLLTKAEIKKVAPSLASPLFDQMEPDDDSLGKAGSACSYPGIVIQLDPYPVTAFEDTRKNFMKSGRTTFQTTTGVGDQAYLYEQDPGKESHVVGIFARAGQHVLTIALDVSPQASAASLRPIALALSKAAVAKLQ